MPIIRCTKKLQKEMGLPAVRVPVNKPEETPLASWHANLIYIARRKCVLFTNDRTLFNFIALDVSRDKIRRLDDLFLSNLSCALHEEDLPKQLVARILDECSVITFGNTNSRSVLGSMNDLAFHYKYHVLEAGGAHGAEAPGIIKKLNRMPMGAIDYAYPIEALKAAYANNR